MNKARNLILVILIWLGLITSFSDAKGQLSKMPKRANVEIETDLTINDIQKKSEITCKNVTLTGKKIELRYVVINCITFTIDSSVETIKISGVVTINCKAVVIKNKKIKPELNLKKQCLRRSAFAEIIYDSAKLVERPINLAKRLNLKLLIKK